jgi:predicted transcriptional regulator
MNAHTDFEQFVADGLRALRDRELSRGSIDEAVLQLLQSSKEPLGQTRIAEMLAHSRDAIRHTLTRLVDAGKITRSREAGGNRKRFMYAATVPGAGLPMAPDEAAVMAAFADGRERTLNDVARKVGKTANPLSLILRRLIGKGLLRSSERKSVMVYRKPEVSA